ncbi:class I SAM-dependent methyltransferase [Bacteroidales bacterium OttesenSCG-928-M06]|nr:class I SAM-dependent methyltransferase [Bacteroidales bacterium OttesenSCG-928-M06]
MMLNEATKVFVREHLSEDIHHLALRFRAVDIPGVDVTFALNQIASRQKSKNKLPSWYSNKNIIYPPPLSLEQCSSEITARYKSTLIKGKTFIDLTGGFGVDTAYIAQGFKKGIYVEKQEELVKIAQHNFTQLNLSQIETIHADSEIFLSSLSSADAIFIDPARRSTQGNKVVLIPDCEPNLIKIQDLLLDKAKYVLVKLSPMLDVKAALRDLKNIEQIHVLSVDNECKELLLLMSRSCLNEPAIACVNFHADRIQSDCFYYSEEKEMSLSFAEQIKEYLYEPNSSILKAGFYKSVARRYNVEKLGINSHLYTSSKLESDFPGRIFKVMNVSSLNKKDMKGFLSGINQANISIRNFPMTVEGLRRKLKLREGGDVYLFATTLGNEKRVLIKTNQLFLL